MTATKAGKSVKGSKGTDTTAADLDRCRTHYDAKGVRLMNLKDDDLVSAVALVGIFMFDAGMNSLPALREYSVSPRRGSTMRIPQ